jgi:hypothetical protein
VVRSLAMERVEAQQTADLTPLAIPGTLSRDSFALLAVTRLWADFAWQKSNYS